MKWNTELYDHKHSFVAKYGEDVIKLLDPREGERVLDVGCGTGHLAEIIRAMGAEVMGIDASEEMVAKAREKYPHIRFEQMSAAGFDLPEQFDAVFSNATLHWVLDKEKAAECIYRALKPGGRFVAELGGKGNVATIVTALQQSLKNQGYAENAERQVWYFPSLAEYSTLLEQKGFRVIYAIHFDRETPLQDHDGIRNWITMFGQPFLQGLNDNAIGRIVREVEQQIKPTNFKNNQWFADYVRLRIVAVK